MGRNLTTLALLLTSALAVSSIGSARAEPPSSAAPPSWIPALPSPSGTPSGGVEPLKPPFPLIERVTSELVLIEAYVTSPDGRPIRGLTASDFALKIDGKVRPIASLEFREVAPAEEGSAGSGAGPAPVGPSVPPPPVPSRRFALFFEDAISSAQGLTAARRAADRFISARLVPSDQVALLAHGKHLRLLADFTADREALHAALDASLRDRSRVSDFSSTLREQEGQLRAALGGPQPATGPQELKFTNFQFLLSTFAARDADVLSGTVTALRSLIDALAPWPGYKAIVYMGDGIPENPAEYYLDRLHDLPQIRAAPFEVQSRAGKHDISLELKKLIDAAGAAGVTIDTVATGGLYAGDAPDSRTPASSGHRADSHRARSLETIAFNTGGLFSNSNDPLVALAQAEDSSRAYYVIGYAPEGPPDGRQHSVQLSLPSVRAFLRWRRGFTRLLPSEARQRTIQAAYTLPEFYTALSLDLTVVPGTADRSGRLADLIVHVPAGQVLFLPEEGHPTARLEVGLVGHDEAGRESLRLARTIRIALPPGQSPQEAPGLDLFQRTHLPHSTQVLTAVVSDLAAGTIGGARVTLRPMETGISEVAGLSIYSLAETSLWLEIAASEESAGRTPAAVGHGLGPTLKSTFTVGEPLACGFRIAEASDAERPALRVVVRRGETVLETLDVTRGSTGETVKMPLPVERLPAGDYVVAVQEVHSDRTIDRAATSFRLAAGAITGSRSRSAPASSAPPSYR